MCKNGLLSPKICNIGRNKAQCLSLESSNKGVFLYCNFIIIETLFRFARIYKQYLQHFLHLKVKAQASPTYTEPKLIVKSHTEKHIQVNTVQLFIFKVPKSVLKPSCFKFIDFFIFLFFLPFLDFFVPPNRFQFILT